MELKRSTAVPLFFLHIFFDVYFLILLLTVEANCHSFELSYVQNIIFPVCKAYFLHKHKTGVANKNWNVSFSALNCCF